MSRSAIVQTGQAETHAEPMGDRLWRGLKHASVAALAISVLIHVLVLMVTTVIAIRTNSGSSPTGVPGAIEVAVISETDLSAMQDADINALAPGVDDLQNKDIENHVTIDLPGGAGMADTNDLGTLGDGLGGAGAGTGMGVGDGAGGAGGGSAKFFGVEARGQRFAYIVDISGSMQGPKMATLKRELASSIDALPEGTQFVVCTFSSDASIVGGKERWTEASPKNKSEAIKLISRLETFGGTEPLPGFGLVLGRIKPRPDAVYFMTDGVFDPEDAERIISLCRTGAKVPVHGISFVSREGEGVVRKIARDTGGTYTHVPGANP